MLLKKARLADQVKKEIKKRIVNVEIEPGEKIDVSALEEEFGISRVPIREALQRLADRNLVDVKPRVGYFAVRLTPKQIKDICELRTLLETYALKKSIDEIAKPKLKDFLQKTSSLKKKDISPSELRSRFDESDEELHGEIIEKSKNELLIDFAERIHDLVALTRHLNKRIEEALNEHISLIKAMLNKDTEKAIKALKIHLQNVEKESLNRYFQLADPKSRERVKDNN